jgi:hypothetical protein
MYNGYPQSTEAIKFRRDRRRSNAGIKELDSTARANRQLWLLEFESMETCFGAPDWLQDAIERRPRLIS